MKRLLIFSIILMALIGSASAAFDPADYTYSEDFFVNSTTAQTNYQVKMILSNATGYSATGVWYTNGTTRDDWLDVAWTDTSNNLLPFWNETGSYTATTSTWWINVSSIADDNTTEIRVHYGDADAVISYANGTATFDFFDDFPGLALDTAKWDTSLGTYTVSNSILNIRGYAAASNIYSKTLFGVNYASKQRMMRKVAGVEYGSYIVGFRDPPSTSNNFAIFYAGWPTANKNNGVNGDNTGTYPTVLFDYPSTNIYHNYEIKRNGITSIIYSVNDGTPQSTTTYLPSKAIPSICGIDGSASGSSAYWDWVFVRKYTAVEPFLTHKPTEAGDPPIASFTCDHTYLRIPQSMTCTDTSTEIPTSWNWSFGDGIYSEDENPVHKYTKRGKWNVTLTATNDAGSDESDATTVRVTGYETYY